MKRWGWKIIIKVLRCCKRLQRVKRRIGIVQSKVKSRYELRLKFKLVDNLGKKDSKLNN